MRVILYIIRIFLGLICIALSFYGIGQFAEMEGENFFEHFGKAAFAFLIVYGCSRLFRAAQKKIDQIDAIENPHALTSRLMAEASDRLGDLSHVDEKIAWAKIEKELDWIEHQEKKVKDNSSSQKTPEADPDLRPNSTLLKTGVDWLGVVVDRSDVEQGNIQPTLDALRATLSDPDTVHLFQGRVDISFDGYNDDSREIYEVPEICQFVRTLDSKFPYWFYFLSTDLDTLRMIAFCFSSPQKLKPGLVHVSPDELQKFIISHFGAMNDLFDQFRLDERVNEEISGRIIDYFAAKPRAS